MKILFIVNVDWFFISHRLPIAYECKKKGYEVHIATNFEKKYNFLANEGFYLHRLNIKRDEFKIYDSIKLIKQIFVLIKKVNPQLVHLITIKPVLLGGMAAQLADKKIGIISSVSGLGFIFITKGIRAEFRKFLIKLMYRTVFCRKNLCVIFQNQDDLNLITKISNLEKRKAVLIEGSGVDLTDYGYSSPPNEKKPTFLFASRLLKSKGIFEFLEASLDHLDTANFLIAGKLDQKNRDCINISELDKWLLNKNITFVGESSEIKNLIKKSSVVVLPSYREGLPKILIEAAAIGRAIITTDVPGCRNTIIHNKTGILVKVKDSKTLSVAIEKLIKNRELSIKMGIEGRKFAEKKFSITNVINSHLEIYNKLILKNSK